MLVNKLCSGMNTVPGSPWAHVRGVAAVCSGVAGRKSLPVCATRGSVLFLSSSFSSLLNLCLFPEVSFPCYKTSLKDKQSGPVWLFHRSKFRAFLFPKELSAARQSGVWSTLRSFLSTPFSPCHLHPHGSSICLDVLWTSHTVTAGRWAKLSGCGACRNLLSPH